MNELRISDLIADCIETDDLQVTHTSYSVATQTRSIRVEYTRDGTRFDIMIRPADETDQTKVARSPDNS